MNGKITSGAGTPIGRVDRETVWKPDACKVILAPKPLRCLLGRRISVLKLHYVNDPDAPHEDLILELDSGERVTISAYGVDGAGVLEVYRKKQS
jgi:hypothetical protein